MKFGQMDTANCFHLDPAPESRDHCTAYTWHLVEEDIRAVRATAR